MSALAPVSLTESLGPGTQLKSLKTFVLDFKLVRPALNDLLTYPHLESIVLKKEPLSGKKLDGENLRDLVLDGSARYAALCSIDMELSKKAITWSSTLSAIIDVLDVASFVETMQPVAQSYADEARGQADNNQLFFTDFTVYIDLLGARIEEMGKRIESLDGEINAQSKAIADANILQTLYEIFKEIYKLASSASDSDVQIATLLGLDVSSLKGSFGKLFTDRVRLDLVLASLTNLKLTITGIRMKFIALHDALTNVVKTSASLIDVWDGVSKRLEGVANDKSSPKPSQITAIKAAWDGVAKNATAFQKAITGLTDSPMPAKRVPVKSFPAKDAPNAHLISKIDFVPQTAEELGIARLLHAAAALPHDIGGAQVQNVFRNSSLAVEGSEGSQSDKENVVKLVLGPPADILERLNSLTDDAGKIVGQFTKLLETPYLDQLSCIDPLDGNTTNIYLMTLHFKLEYVKLQAKSIEAARKLGSYADLQKTLLPLVVPGVPDPSKGELSLRQFIETNGPLVKEYLDFATQIVNESLTIKNQWDNAIAVVRKGIRECELAERTTKETIEKLSNQQKTATIYSLLAGVGAFVAFSAAAFVPGVGILCLLAVGGVLGGLSIQQAIEANKLDAAINELQTKVNVVSESKAKLEKLLPPMLEIAASLSRITTIWSDIATALQKADTLYSVLGGPTGPILLNTLRPRIIANWNDVSMALANYIVAIM